MFFKIGLFDMIFVADAASRPSVAGHGEGTIPPAEKPPGDAPEIPTVRQLGRNTPIPFGSLNSSGPGVMTIQQQREKHCMDLSEMFRILPETEGAENAHVKWARSMLLDLIGHKIECLRKLGMDWR